MDSVVRFLIGGLKYCVHLGQFPVKSINLKVLQTSMFQKEERSNEFELKNLKNVQHLRRLKSNLKISHSVLLFDPKHASKFLKNQYMVSVLKLNLIFFGVDYLVCQMDCSCACRDTRALSQPARLTGQSGRASCSRLRRCA